MWRKINFLDRHKHFLLFAPKTTKYKPFSPQLKKNIFKNIHKNQTFFGILPPQKVVKKISPQFFQKLKWYSSGF
jgi:hypothetical protein